MLKRLFAALAILAAAATSSLAQSPICTAPIPVQGTQFLDNFGNPLASGLITFTLTDTSNTPVNYTVQGGSPSTASFTQTIKNGVMATTVAGQQFTIPCPATTSPTGIVFRIVVTNTAQSLTYLTLPLTAITGPNYSFNSYVAQGNSSISGYGNPRVNCVPGAQYADTSNPGSTIWACSKLLTDQSIVWTQNPSSSPQCGLGFAVAQQRTGPQYCIPSSIAFAAPGFELGSPTTGTTPGPISLIVGSNTPGGTNTVSSSPPGAGTCNSTSNGNLWTYTGTTPSTVYVCIGSIGLWQQISSTSTSSGSGPPTSSCSSTNDGAFYTNSATTPPTVYICVGAISTWEPVVTSPGSTGLTPPTNPCNAANNGAFYTDLANGVTYVCVGSLNSWEVVNLIGSISGSGAPTVACNTANNGQLYTNTVASPPAVYVCVGSISTWEPIVIAGGTSGGTPPASGSCSVANSGQIYTDTGTTPPTQYICVGSLGSWEPINSCSANPTQPGCSSGSSPGSPFATIPGIVYNLGPNTSQNATGPEALTPFDGAFNGPWFPYGPDLCVAILAAANTGSLGTVGGDIEMLGPSAAMVCGYNAAGAAPFGNLVYSTTTHSTIGPSWDLTLPAGPVFTDVQWVVPNKTHVGGKRTIAGAQVSPYTATTINASVNFVTWISGATVTMPANYTTTPGLMTITGGVGYKTSDNVGIPSGSYPFNLAPGNFIQIKPSIVGGLPLPADCLNNAWRVDAVTSSSVTAWWVPSSSCTMPTATEVVSEIKIPVIVVGNSAGGTGAAAYGGDDEGDLLHDIGGDCNPNGISNAAAYSATPPTNWHPQNCTVIAVWTANEAGGLWNVDIRNGSADALEVADPSPEAPGSTGSPSDFTVGFMNILLDPNFASGANPHAGVEAPTCALFNTHGDGAWAAGPLTCKVERTGTTSSYAGIDGIQVVGTASIPFNTLHVEGAQNGVHLMAPVLPELSQNRANQFNNVLCPIIYPGGTCVLIDANSGYPNEFHGIEMGAGGGYLYQDNSAQCYDSADAYVADYVSLYTGFCRSSTLSGVAPSAIGEILNGIVSQPYTSWGEYSATPVVLTANIASTTAHSFTTTCTTCSFGYGQPIVNPTYFPAGTYITGIAYDDVSTYTINTSQLPLATSASASLSLYNSTYAMIRATANGTILSCQSAGGCSLFLRPEGTSSNYNSYAFTPTGMTLQGAFGSPNNNQWTLTLPTGFTGAGTVHPQPITGYLPVQDAPHTGVSGAFACYNSVGALTTCPGAGQLQKLILTTGICTTANTSYATCTFGAAWGVAMNDANYALSCSSTGTISFSSGSCSGGGSCQPVLSISENTLTTTGFVIQLQNGTQNGAAAMTTSALTCIGVD